MNIKNRPDSFDSFRFRWHLGDTVAGSAMPGRHGELDKDLKKLRQEGIELIVNLTCTTLHIPDEFKDSFSVIHMSMVDGHPPDTEQLDQIMDLVGQALSTGRRTVIHCRGGMGRTASVIIPLLMEFEELSLKEAEKKVRASGRFIQTNEQREFLESWARDNGPRK